MMLNKRKYVVGISAIVLVALGGYFYFSYKPQDKPRQRTSFSDLKCPDDYQTDEERNTAFQNFVDYFYEYNPSGSLDYLAESRIEFYARKNCTATLQRFSNSKLEDVEPGWRKIAESCTKVGSKIFCKLKGE